MKKFYLMYGKTQTLSGQSFDTPGGVGREILQTPSAKSSTQEKSATVSRISPTVFSLNWSHYVFLMGIDDENERRFYEIESANQNWSLRELGRQFNSSLYERLALSRDKEKVRNLNNNVKLHLNQRPPNSELITFSLRIRKVSPGQFGPYPSFRSRIWQSSSRGRPCQYRITFAWHQGLNYNAVG